MEVFTKLQELFVLYDQYFIVIFIAFMISFFFSPLTGVIAQKIGAIDAPPQMRDREDSTKFRRIHDRAMPQLGGLAVVMGLAGAGLYALTNGYFADNYQALFHITLGVGLIALLGFMDSRGRGVSAKNQLLIQVLAAFIITLGGIRIDFIEIMGFKLDFETINFTLTNGGFVLSISPLADIITIFWIIAVVNAMNWVSGIDGLAASMSMFASLTLLFIGVKYETVFAAVIAAMLFGAILGFWPYNFPPAKTFNGSIGDMVQGYLLAVLAIISGAKLSASLILLALPLVDAIWVLSGRLLRHRSEIKGISDLMSISDKTHLHHRFLKTGLTVRETLTMEMTIYVAFCIAAYYFAGFRQETLMLLGVVLVILIMFTILGFIHMRKSKQELMAREAAEMQANQPKKHIITETPEEKYAY